MIRVFCGYDKREAAGFHVFVQSLIETSTNYVLMPPLSGKQGDGSTAFTYKRFAIPELCNWSGPALFVDGSDMLLKDDISELVSLFNHNYAVQVVKHEYKTKHRRKFVGTEMEADNRDYPMKNWSSVMLFNCGHPAHFRARSELRKMDGPYLHRFGWLRPGEIGELPSVWNWLVDEFGENPDAKLLHWTLGMPGFKHYANAPMSQHWHEIAKTMHSER